MSSTSDLIAAVGNHLRATLPAQCVAAGVDAPRRVILYEPVPITPALAPDLWVLCTGIRPIRPAGFGGPDGGTVTRERDIEIGITVAAENAEIACTRAYIYADLILAAMTANLNASGQASGVRHKETRFSGNLSRSRNGLFQIAVLEFSATRWAVLGQD